MMISPVMLRRRRQLASDLISLGGVCHISIVGNGKLLDVVSERDLIGRAPDHVPTRDNRNRADLLNPDDQRNHAASPRDC